MRHLMQLAALAFVAAYEIEIRQRQQQRQPRKTLHTDPPVQEAPRQAEHRQARRGVAEIDLVH